MKRPYQSRFQKRTTFENGNRSRPTEKCETEDWKLAKCEKKHENVAGAGTEKKTQ